MGRYRLTASAVAAAASCASALFIPASSPLVLWQGRTQVNADASVSFDWEGTAATFTLTPTTAGAPISWVKMHATVSTARATRFAVISTNGSTSYVTDAFAASSAVSEYLVLAYLQAVVPVHRITVWNGMEPSNSGSAPGQDITVLGFEVSDDGQFVATSPLPRRMDVIGDSITAGSQQNREGLICGDWTTTNNQVFNWESYMARNFGANTTTVAWSGRGLTANCGDPNQTEPRLPELYTWTEGGTPGALWDFSAQTAPDAVLINAGTNDFACANPVNATLFTQTYVDLMVNITAYYAQSPLSPWATERAARAGSGPAPSITFFCGVGPITDAYANATQAAIAGARALGINAHYLDLTGATLDGCGNHPGFYGHYDMFTKGQPVVAAVMGW